MSSLYPKSSNDQEICVICLNPVTSRNGEAVFIAQCDHSFHFNCIADNVKSGNKCCPLCRCEWDDLPAVLLRSTPTTLKSSPLIHYHESQPSSANEPAQTDQNYKPRRAPMDLVLVADVSSSMRGLKLSLLKHAVTFIIQNLGSNDRLAIVTFSSAVRQIFPLLKMPNACKESRIRTVNSIVADGGTDILAGLKRGFEILHERRDRNPVESVVLLSDGKDSSNITTAHVSNPSSIVPVATAVAAVNGTPVHAFGFGADHGLSTLNGLSEVTNGIFFPIESVEFVCEAFRICIGDPAGYGATV